MSVAVQLVGLVAATGTGVLVARVLGPAGVGVYALVVAMVSFGIVVCGLGLSSGITFRVSQGRWGADRAQRESERAALGMGLAGGALLCATFAILGGTALKGVTWSMVLFAAAALPMALSWTFSSAIALATEQYGLYGLGQVAQPLSALLATGVLAAIFAEVGAVGAYAASFVFAWVVARGSFVRSRPARPAVVVEPGDKRSELRSALQFGARAWGADLLQLLNYRLDLFILNTYASAADVGYYAVAVAVTALGWILPGALQAVLFPRTARLAVAGDDASNGEDTVLAAFRHGVVIMPVTGLCLAMLLLVAVPLFYGPAFERSTTLGLILLPGVLAIGVAKLFSAVITGRGHPEYSLYNALITAPVTLAMYFVLISRYKAVGAAAASSVSYCLSTVIAWYFVRRVTSIRLALVLNLRSVMTDYRTAAINAVSAVRSLLARRPASYRPGEYWEARAANLIDTYDNPETWAERGWTTGAAEETQVPRILKRTGARSVLVVGVGTGRQYEFLTHMKLNELRGIDISPTLVSVCRQRHPAAQTEVDDLLGADERHPAADAVLSTAVLQHVPPRDITDAVGSVKGLARRIVIIRELTLLTDVSTYTWAHDYPALFSDWRMVHDEVTDSTERYVTRLMVWERPSNDRTHR